MTPFVTSSSSIWWWPASTSASSQISLPKHESIKQSIDNSQTEEDNNAASTNASFTSSDSSTFPIPTKTNNTESDDGFRFNENPQAKGISNTEEPNAISDVDTKQRISAEVSPSQNTEVPHSNFKPVKPKFKLPSSSSKPAVSKFRAPMKIPSKSPAINEDASDNNSENGECIQLTGNNIQ